MLDQINWTLSAFAQVVRPLLRLALRMGLKYNQVDAVLRTVLLDEAKKILIAQSTRKPNVSQLSTATGINRKDVMARVRATTPYDPAAQLPPSAQVLTAWMQLAAENPAHIRLPIAAANGTLSFEDLATQATRGNVHHRAVLDDLLRLGMAVQAQDSVELKSDGFLPSTDLQYMLGFLAEHTGDHLQAAVSNVLGDAPKMLERAVYADGLSREECERIHQIARLRWAALHQELVKELTLSVARSPDGDQRIKVGIYTFYEDDAAHARPAPGDKP
ncbi:MAG: hypothetical protein HXX19_01135 [Rhodoferax sp.]|nr:hypothetical protein [Rhodoferax sp.]